MVTTDSDHGLPVYPNRTREMALTGLDQLWVADLTYIRLLTEFVYLAVILDAFSRRVIGWALDRTLEDTLTLAALRMALQRRQPTPRLVHHSDRGVQYASRDYTALLLEHGVQISMSRRGNPYDNATCESFLKTLKYEEVYRQEYRDLPEARASIQRFLEKVGCTRPWAIFHPPSSSARSGCRKQRRGWGGPRRTAPGRIVSMSFRLAIPGRLRSRIARLRFTSRCASRREAPSLYNAILANGKQCLNCLSHPRGQPHSVAIHSDRSAETNVK